MTQGVPKTVIILEIFLFIGILLTVGQVENQANAQHLENH
jgi:hypothetical protein